MICAMFPEVYNRRKDLLNGFKCDANIMDMIDLITVINMCVNYVA